MKSILFPLFTIGVSFAAFGVETRLDTCRISSYPTGTCSFNVSNATDGDVFILPVEMMLSASATAQPNPDTFRFEDPYNGYSILPNWEIKRGSGRIVRAAVYGIELQFTYHPTNMDNAKSAVVEYRDTKDVNQSFYLNYSISGT